MRYVTALLAPLLLLLARPSPRHAATETPEDWIAPLRDDRPARIRPYAPEPEPDLQPQEEARPDPPLVRPYYVAWERQRRAEAALLERTLAGLHRIPEAAR